MTIYDGFLGLVERHAGLEAARDLARKRGGTEIKLSAHPRSVLARIVGADAAKAIVEERGPEKVTVPMGDLRGQKARRAAISHQVAAGRSNSQVALACDVHERTVRRVRERLKTPLPLFPDD
jgi:DNA-binding NarL/FixJ family response regulator